MIYSYIVAFLLLITRDLKTSAVTDCFEKRIMTDLCP